MTTADSRHERGRPGEQVSAYSHVWKSGAEDLPSFSLGEQYKGIATPLYFVSTGLRVNDFTFDADPTGRPSMQINVIGKSQTNSTSTGAGTPTQLDYTRFHNFFGFNSNLCRI